MLRKICITMALAGIFPGCTDTEPAGNTGTDQLATENGGPAQTGSANEAVRKADQRPTVNLPEDLPEDITIYPDSRPTAAGTTGGGFRSATMTLILLETSDDIDTVRDFYAKELEKHEWSVNDDVPGENLFLANKGERKFQIQLHELPLDQPTVDITLSFTRPELDQTDQK